MGWIHKTQKLWLPSFAWTLIKSPYITTVILFSPADDPNALSSNCCTKLGIPSECHFLCGVGKVGFWTKTRWKCTHKYFAKVATCKVQNKIGKQLVKVSQIIDVQSVPMLESTKDFSGSSRRVLKFYSGSSFLNLCTFHQ